MQSTRPISKRSAVLFQHYSKDQEQLKTKDLRVVLQEVGFLPDDPRWQSCYEKLLYEDKIDKTTFNHIFVDNLHELRKAASQELIINSFNLFCNEISNIYEDLKDDISGEVANDTFLKKVDPNKFGIGLCTVDGQRYHKGDHADHFTIQSCSFPITYAIALERLGEDEVHSM